MTRSLRLVTWLTVWLLGAVVALLTGNLTLYGALTAFYLASRAVARIRSLRGGRAPQVEAGD